MRCKVWTLAESSSLLLSLPAGNAHDVVGEHLKLKRLLRNNAAHRTKLALQDAKHVSTNYYDECWDVMRNAFPTLLLFACGFAAVLTGSSTVESDVSIVKVIKSDNRSSLAELSVDRSRATVD
jgi:hypothetical protein